MTESDRTLPCEPKHGVKHDFGAAKCPFPGSKRAKNPKNPSVLHGFELQIEQIHGFSRGHSANSDPVALVVGGTDACQDPLHLG